MATQVKRLPLESGGHVLIEIYEGEEAIERVGIAEQAARTFEDAWETVMPVIQSLSRKMATCKPTEAQIKFGIKLGSDFNVVLVSAKGEANFEITLTWKN